MRICSNSGCFKDTLVCLSPNRNERPIGPLGQISLLVIHGISLPPNEFGTQAVHDLFLNQLDPSAHPYYKEIADLRVSSHLFIDRKGVVTQFVPFVERAWHAGESGFHTSQGYRTGCNDYSIGIELEGSDSVEYTPEQYGRLITCTKAIIQTYPEIKLENIVGHSDIAPGRKTDPGPFFDWNLYKSALS